MFAPLLASASWLHKAAPETPAIPPSEPLSNAAPAPAAPPSKPISAHPRDASPWDHAHAHATPLRIGLCFVHTDARTPALRAALMSALGTLQPAPPAAVAVIEVSSALQLPAAVLCLANAGASVAVCAFTHAGGKLLPSLLTTMSAGCGLPVIQVCPPFYWHEQ